MSEQARPVPGFTITRVVNAPRETVWRLWTDPAELAYWFHPAGMSTPRESVQTDVRVGGHYRYTMVADDSGAQSPTGGQYLEVREPERLVFTWADPSEPEADPPVITVTLADLGDRTEITFELQGAAGRPGDHAVHDGWSEALVQVGDLADRRVVETGAA